MTPSTMKRTDVRANRAQDQWTAADVKRLRAEADAIETALPLTDREAALLDCLTHRRRADGRLLRVRAIAKCLGQTGDEIHDTLGALERKNFISRPSTEVGTYRLEVLATEGGVRV